MVLLTYTVYKKKHNYSIFKVTLNTLYLIGSSKYLRLGNMPLQQVKFGWTEFGGDFLAPAGRIGI